MYKVKLIAEAQQELRKEIRYSRRTWGLAHAKTYHKELRTQIASLRDTPLLHPIRNDILPGIRIKIYKGNQIIYLIQEKKRLVVVLAILSTYQSVDQNGLTRRKNAI